MVAYIFDVLSIGQSTPPTQTFVCYSQNLLYMPVRNPDFPCVSFGTCTTITAL